MHKEYISDPDQRIPEHNRRELQFLLHYQPNYIISLGNIIAVCILNHDLEKNIRSEV